MIPIVAIVGTPNVGKSTLFNRLTRSRDALVADEPGVTRDRRYGLAACGERRFVLVDTGGLGLDTPDDPELPAQVSEQTLRAVEEADVILWLVDGRSGLSAADEQLGAQFRTCSDRLHVVVNKTEGRDPAAACAEFFALGMGDPLPISAEHGLGVEDMMDQALSGIPAGSEPEDAGDEGLRICVVGRPNAGKSTLINRLLGEERMLTRDSPGTTRDSVAIPFSRRGKNYVLVDTAGVRRRARISAPLERLSVAKSLQAIDEARVVVLVVDAREGITEQDLTLVGLTMQGGKSLIIAINKWDGLTEEQKQRVRRDIDRRLEFVRYASVHFISALHGTGVGKLLEGANRIAAAQGQAFKSSELTTLLQEAIAAHPPPTVQGRRIKLRYAHLGGHDPIRIIVHGNQTDRVPATYGRYLSTFFQDRLGLSGTPVRVEFKYGENPYKGRKDASAVQRLRKRKRQVSRRRR